jgi:hypothetical protein
MCHRLEGVSQKMGGVVMCVRELHPNSSNFSSVGRAGRALVLTNRPILLKGPGAINGWLVGAGRLSDLVGRAVRGDGTLVLGLRRGVVGTEVLNDVVLDERVAGPTVDGKVGVAVVVVGTGVGDGTGSSWVPSLSTDKVTAASPAHAVLTSGAVGVGSTGTTIRPPGPEAAVVDTLTVGGVLTGDERNVSGGGSKSAGGGDSSSDDGGEGNHFE